MADKAWKQFERRVASDWQTTRTALSGGNSKVTRSDTHHPQLFLECKLNARSPFWTLFLKTRPLAKKEGKTPMLCVGNKNHPGYLVVVHIDDLPLLLEQECVRSKKVKKDSSKKKKAKVPSSFLS